MFLARIVAAPAAEVIDDKQRHEYDYKEGQGKDDVVIIGQSCSGRVSCVVVNRYALADSEVRSLRWLLNRGVDDPAIDFESHSQRSSPAVRNLADCRRC